MKQKGADKTVRVGLVGVGNMGGWHAQSMVEGRAGRCRLAAVCDTNPAALDRWGGIPRFTDSRKLVRSGLVDAVVIATPHYFHPPIAVDALDNGLHVLTEKPMAVHKAGAQLMARAHGRRKRLVFAEMFQMRTYGLFKRLRNLVRGGELGTVRRIIWIASDWFRSDAYYSSGGWRATWKGEGGGILTNQCVHNLDIWQWIFGMPEVVRGYCGFGRYHDIEVEDDVTAYFGYRNGSSGIFVASTGEAPGFNRLEVAADMGCLTVEAGKITFRRNEVSAREFSRSTKTIYETPDHWVVRVPTGEAGGDHAAVLANFADAILDRAPLVAPAEEGMRQVELSNAIVYSSLKGREVRLPLPVNAFSRELKRLIACSKRKGCGTAGAGIHEVPKYIRH